MSILETNLRAILEEKNNKIVPSNIKKGVNIFGVEGECENGGGSSDYIELEYIEGTGTQYVDTGFNPNHDTSIELEVSNVSSLDAPMISSSSKWQAGTFILTAGGNYYKWYYNNETVIGQINSRSIDKIFLYRKYTKFNDAVISENTNINSSIFSDNTLWIFSGPSAGSQGKFTKFRLHSFKIMSSGLNEERVYARDFIPAKQISTGEVGLYDKVDNVFYPNKGTGMFVAGPEVGEIVNDEPEYEELKYINFNGTQHLDTLYPLWKSANWKIDYKFSVPEFYNYIHLFSVADDDILNEIWINQNAKYSIRIASASTGKQEINNGYLSVNEDYTVIHDCVNNIITTEFNNSIINTYDCSTGSHPNLNLRFGKRDTGIFKGTLYYLKMYDNGTLVRDFIPVQKTSNNRVALYDKVEKKYYYSSGTEDFIAGPKLSEIEIIPTKNTQTLEGKFTKVTIHGDSDLVSNNIRKGANVFGIEGTYEGSTNIDSDNEVFVALQLPEGTSQVEYIQGSDSIPIFNTGYRHKANTNVEAQFMQLTGTGVWWVNIFGARNVDYKSAAFTFFSKFTPNTVAGGPFAFCRTGSEVSTNKSIFGQKLTLTTDGLSATFTDGTTTETITTTGTLDDGVNDFFLLGINTAGPDGVQQGSNSTKYTRLYYLKIFEGDQLLHHYIACKTNDGQAGFYDLIDKKHILVPSSQVTTGPVVEQPTIVRETVYIKQLEYIQGSGTQYIDTGIVPTNHKVEIKFYYTSYVDNKALFGADVLQYSLTWFSNKWYGYYNGVEKQFTPEKYHTALQTVIFNNDNNKIEIDGVEYADVSGSTNPTKGLLLFTRYGTDVPHDVGYAPVRIYYCKIYDKSTNNLVRDFIPAKDNNNIACLYDKVSKTYFYNQGTGDFSYGI